MNSVNSEYGNSECEYNEIMQIKLTAISGLYKLPGMSTSLAVEMQQIAQLYLQGCYCEMRAEYLVLICLDGSKTVRIEFFKLEKNIELKSTNEYSN